MSGQNKQLVRLIRFVSELKQNNYPNCHSFADKLREIDIYEHIDIACSAKTIQRDIKVLKDKFNAPIEFDYERNGYYLKHHGWNFECPVFSEEDVLSWVLGAKIATGIMPNPIKTQIEQSIADILTNNNPDFLDTATINSLVIAASNYKINPDIFRIVFNAWINKKSLLIRYKTPENELSERKIDPHVLSFYNDAWYLVSYCHLRKEKRTFAIHRISEAEELQCGFEYDSNMMDLAKGIPFKYSESVSAEILCSSEIAGFFSEYAEGKGYKLTNNSDGTLTIYIDSIYKKDLIRLILEEGGEMKLVKPKNLISDIKEAAEKVIAIH